MKKLLTILFLIVSFAGFGQIGIVNMDTIQTKNFQVDSAFWIKYIAPLSTDSVLVRSNGKVGYAILSDVDSVFPSPQIRYL